MPPFYDQAKVTEDLLRRIRSLEQDVETLKNKLETVGGTTFKKLQKEEEAVTSEQTVVKQVQRDIEMIKSEIMEIKKELGRVASNEKVQELEGYISMINPMNFVTKDEVKRMIGEK